MTRVSNFVILSMLLITLCSIGDAQTKDYSTKGPEFALLHDIRLAAVRVDSAGTHEISVEGHTLEAASFKIVTKEPAPLLDGYNPYNNVVKDIDLQYELLVAEDKKNVVHDKLIRIIKEICELPVGERNFSLVGLVGERGKYLIYSGPAGTPNYVWFDGRVVFVRFLSMRDKRRDHALTTETFWKEKIRFFANGQKVVLEGVPKSFAADFKNRLANGDFRRPGS